MQARRSDMTVPACVQALTGTKNPFIMSQTIQFPGWEVVSGCVCVCRP